MKKVYILIVIMLMSLCLLAACAPAGPSAETPSPDETPTETPAASTAGKSIIRMTASGNPMADPALGENWMQIYCFINLYDALLTYDAQGNLVNQLAESYEMSEDGLTYTFKLKEGVLFHDGSEVTASDVVFSFNRLLGIGLGYAYMFGDYVASVEAPDEYTVVFRMNAPLGTFPDRLPRLHIVNEDLIMANLVMDDPVNNYGEFGDYGRNYLLSHDAGSGPYQVVELSQQNHLLAEKFADYHLGWGENAPEQIQLINMIEAATVRTMMSTRELEVTDNWQTTETYAALAQIDGVDVVQISDAAMHMMAINCQKAPTDDPKVRQAMACLINYATICANIYPGSTQSVSPAAVSLPGAATKISGPRYEYNLEQAEQYIAESAYADTISEYTLDYYITSGVPSQEKIALMVKGAAEQIGLNINIASGPYTTYSEGIQSVDGTPHLATSSMAPYFYDAGAMFESYYTSGSLFTATNPTCYEDPVLEGMISAAASLTDKDERYAAYAEIEDYILNTLSWIPMCDVVENVAYQADYVYWPAAEDFADGTVNRNCIGYHYWFHDWEVYPDKIN